MPPLLPVTRAHGRGPPSVVASIAWSRSRSFRFALGVFRGPRSSPRRRVSTWLKPSYTFRGPQRAPVSLNYSPPLLMHGNQGESRRRVGRHPHAGWGRGDRFTPGSRVFPSPNLGLREVRAFREVGSGPGRGIAALVSGVYKRQGPGPYPLPYGQEGSGCAYLKLKGP